MKKEERSSRSIKGCVEEEADATAAVDEDDESIVGTVGMGTAIFIGFDAIRVLEEKVTGMEVDDDAAVDEDDDESSVRSMMPMCRSLVVRFVRSNEAGEEFISEKTFSLSTEAGGRGVALLLSE